MGYLWNREWIEAENNWFWGSGDSRVVAVMRRRMKFPVLSKGLSVLPPEGAGPKCPWCKKNKVLEPHSMAIIMAGAFWKVGPDNFSSGSETDNFAFMEFCWHGAHDGGEGHDRDIGTFLSIVEGAQGGGFLTSFLFNGLSQGIFELLSR